MECNIDNLPDEILEYILSLIPPYKDLKKCMFVSKRWCRITKNVIERNEAHFQKSVAYGSLYWTSWSHNHWPPTIGKRHSHSACIHENSMYVFGGCTAESTSFNDLWRLDLDSKKWIRPVTMGNYPSPKACATMVYYKKKFILFGGWSQPSSHLLYQQWKLFNELHVYSIESNRWSVIDNASENPPPLSAHSATVHKNLMVVFGGMTDEYSTNSVWCLNLDTFCWHKQRTSEVQPQSRYGQSQIQLDDTHLLIMGGCTGPNRSINDAWMLALEGPVWTWKEINISHSEYAPKRILCHQACKTGNYIIVLGKKKRQSQPRNMSISLSKLACRQMPVPQVLNPADERLNRRQEIDKDENVNGKHGILPRSALRNKVDPLINNNIAMTKTLPAYIFEHTLTMAAFRDETARPTFPPRPSANRQRQLESLRRMEERIQSQKSASKTAKNTDDTLGIFILDISNVLGEECTAAWVPWKQSDQMGPDERILYSLVLGKGELIVFGGIRKEKVTVQGQTVVDESEVYNDLHFINPPKYKI